MSVEENKELVRRAYELINRRELNAFFELLAPEYVEHLPTGGISLEQVKQYALAFLKPFPMSASPSKIWSLRGIR